LDVPADLARKSTQLWVGFLLQMLVEKEIKKILKIAIFVRRYHRFW
jgi:hypothetical protein